MEKTYVIKDAEKVLVYQIEQGGTQERKPMKNNPIKYMKEMSVPTTRDSEGYCALYKMDCGDGLGLMTVYQVYP